MATSVRLLALAALALLANACGGRSNAPAADTSLWPSNATQLVATDAGGGLPVPTPVGSDCQESGAGSYTLTVSNRNLSWSFCASQVSSPNKLTTGSRTLTAEEYQSVVTSVKALTIATGTGCGSDKSSESLQISTPSDSQGYLDSFYECDHQGVYVDNIDDVFDTLYGLGQ